MGRKIQCLWMYRDQDIDFKINLLLNMVKTNDEIIFKIYTYVDFESNVFIEKNDLIVLNVYSHKYIEIIVYMIQEVGDKVSIHCTPDLTQFILRVT